MGIHNRIAKLLLIMMLCFCPLSFSSSIKVGVGISGPPLVENVNTDQGPYYFGFCIDLMDEICKRIGELCTYQPVTSNNQFALLDSGDIDLEQLYVET